MTLDIFTKTLGDTNVVWPTDVDEQAELAVKVLDAVQVVVDVLVEEGVQYEASFAVNDSAYTDHQKRRIVISAKPMTEGGHSLSEVAAIMTGFAVHEIGHTDSREREFTTALRAEWPGKTSPKRLGNILSDVRLEATKIARYAGLRDVFVPTMKWVADATCPTFDLTYGKTLHDRLNFVGQAVRYQPFVSFAADAETQSQLRWWSDWGAVTAQTDNETMLRLVREGIERIRQGAEYELEPPPENPTNSPEGEPATGDGEPNPDHDLDDTEGEDTHGGGDSDESNDDESDEDSDGEADDEDEPGESNGSPTEGEDLGESSDTDSGEAEDGESSDGEPDGEAEGEPEDGGEYGENVYDGQLDEGETLDREKTDAQLDGDGVGGSGKAVSESNDDPDEGLVEDKLNKTQDELTEGDFREKYENERIQQMADEERSSSRIDAGAFGKMKVKVQW